MDGIVLHVRRVAFKPASVLCTGRPARVLPPSSRLGGTSHPNPKPQGSGGRGGDWISSQCGWTWGLGLEHAPAPKTWRKVPECHQAR